MTTRNTLTHVDYHKVCVFLGTLARNNMIDLPLPEIEHSIRSATGVVVSPRPLIKMLYTLGYGYQDGTPAAILMQQQRDLKRLEEALEGFGRLVNQLDNDFDQMKRSQELRQKYEWDAPPKLVEGDDPF